MRNVHVKEPECQQAERRQAKQFAYQPAGSLSPRALARQTVPGCLQLAASRWPSRQHQSVSAVRARKGEDNGIINMAARRPPAKGATPEVDSPKSTIPTNTIPTSKPPAAATTTRKQPPVEKPSDIRRRTWVILSFWFIVVCLGLPIWWETTTIYRANLPLTEMLEWSDGKVWRHPL